MCVVETVHLCISIMHTRRDGAVLHEIECFLYICEAGENDGLRLWFAF